VIRLDVKIHLTGLVNAKQKLPDAFQGNTEPVGQQNNLERMICKVQPAPVADAENNQHNIGCCQDGEN
jgi:hypothetical protein